MGITFRHQAAGAMIGAYAAGQASSRRRGRKYAMNMLQQQQRQQQRQRMQTTGTTGRQMEGRWDDPLAQLGLEGQDAVLQRAQQNARARKYRTGKDIPAGWQPKFTSQKEIEAGLDKKEDKRQWDRKVAREDEVRDRKQTVAQREARVTNLPAVPKDLAITDPGQYRRLTTRRSDITQMGIGGELDFDAPDGEAQETLDGAIQRYENTINSLPDPDLNQGGLVWEEGKGMVAAGTRKPTHWSQGPGQQPVMTEEYKAKLAAQAKQATQDARDEAKRQSKIGVLKGKIEDMKIKEAEALDGQGVDEHAGPLIKEKRDRLEKELGDLQDAQAPAAGAGGGPATGAPAQQPTQQAPGPVGAADRAEALARYRERGRQQAGAPAGGGGLLDTSQVRTPEQIAAEEAKQQPIGLAPTAPAVSSGDQAFVKAMKEKVAGGEQPTPDEVEYLRTIRKRMAQ